MEQEGSSTVMTPPSPPPPPSSPRPVKTNRKEAPRPLNMLQEVFLMNVYYLDRSLSKFAVVGIFERESTSLGILIKAGRSNIFWSYDTLNQLSPYFEKITENINDIANNTTMAVSSPRYKLDHSKDGVKVRKVFGKLYVQMSDCESKILLNPDEWDQLLSNITQIKKYLTELWLHQESIQHFISLVLQSEEDDDAIPPGDLPSHFVNRLVDEVLFYKKWLVWNKRE